MASLDLATFVPKSVLDRFAPALSGNGRTAVIVGGAAAATAIIGIALWSSGPSYSVLYAGLSGEEGGRAIAELQKLNIPFQITEGGRVILVPAAEAGRARLQLAARGVPKQDSDQWALLDNESLGVSPFVEQVHYSRALETALSHTVKEVEGVVAATVKLALPKQTEFLADSPKPSASVMVRLRPGMQLTLAQIDGLTGLVAGSVPGLARENVTIVDQSGKILNANSKDPLQQVPQQLELAREVARQYETSLTDLLVPVLGRGNFRIAADADIDFSQSKENLVKYGEAHVLSQDETVHPHSSDGEQAIGIPGALSNRRPETPTAPISTQKPATAAGAQTGPTSANSPSEPSPAPLPDTHRTTNFDLDKSVQFREHPPWSLRALNIAVLVNNPSGRPIPAERIHGIDTLVGSAIGVGDNRHVNVIDLPFAEDGVAAGETTRAWWREPWMVSIGQNTVLALAGLFVLFGGVLPLLRRVAATQPLAAWTAAALDRSLEMRRTEPAVNLPPAAAERPGIGAETVRLLVADDPGRTAQVIKEWLARDGRSVQQAG